MNLKLQRIVIMQPFITNIWANEQMRINSPASTIDLHSSAGPVTHVSPVIQRGVLQMESSWTAQFSLPTSRSSLSAEA